MRNFRSHSCSKMQSLEEAPGPLPLQDTPIATEQDGGPSLGSSLVQCSSSWVVSTTLNIEPSVNLAVDTVDIFTAPSCSQSSVGLGHQLSLETLVVRFERLLIY